MKCLNGFKLSSNMKMMFDGCLTVCVHVGRFARMLGKDMLIRNNFRTKNIRIVPLHFDEEIAFWTTMATKRSGPEVQEKDVSQKKQEARSPVARYRRVNANLSSARIGRVP